MKIHGLSVDLGEVASVLRSHPMVAEGLAAAQEIGDEIALVGYVVPASPISRDAITARALREFLLERLPSHMIPATFVVLDAVPRTPGSEIDRQALPPPSPRNEVARDASAPPVGPTEVAVVEICSALLCRESLGTNQNFFDLGGDSFKATQLVARVQDRLGVKLSMRSIFDAADMKSLASTIDGESTATRSPSSTELEKRDGNSPVCTTPVQHRMWLVDRLYSIGAAYNVSNAVRLRGKLSVPALRRALDEMVARHEVLRTVFPAESADCRQEVLPHLPLDLPLDDLRRLPLDAREQTAMARVREHVGRKHDLGQGPLFSCQLLILGDEEHVLSLVFSHIIHDGSWSSWVFFKELGELYEHYHLRGADAISSPLAPMPFQFADYAAWEQRRMVGSQFGEHIEYWRNELASPPPALSLPSDRVPPSVPSFRGGQVAFALPARVRLALMQFYRSERATVFMCLLAAWQLLLARYSGQSDIMVGTPTGRRHQSQSEGMIGPFINNLVMRVQLSQGVSFRELLAQVRTKAISAFSHDDLPFEQLLEMLQSGRGDGALPYLRHFFIHRSAIDAHWEIPGLILEPLNLHGGGSKFDLTLSALEEEQGLTGTLEYSADLFDEDTAERLAANYITLLSEALRHPTVPVEALEVTSEAEKRLLVDGWNASGVPYPSEKRTHQLFEDHARTRPDAIAVVSDEGNLTYAELDARANSVAARLRASNVGPDTLVGVCLHRSPNLVVALLAVMKSGGAYVPLDPDFPAERLRYMLADCKASVLLSEAEVAKSLGALDAEVIRVSEHCGNAAPAQVTGRPQDLAYVIYTSGSTGKPKGVQLTHRSLTNFLWAMKEEPGLTSDDVVQSVTTICFDIAVLEIYLPLIVGARVVINSRETAMSPRLLLDSMTRHGVTVMQATPVTWRMLIEHGWRGEPRVKVLCGGEAMGLKLAQQLIDTGCEVWNMYGPTETTVWSTAGRVEKKEDALFVGSPIANTQLYVMTPGLRLQPIGVPGELLIGGDGLARGYLGREELTRARFVQSELTGARLYRTGDLVVRRRSGAIEFMGRIDSQVKVRGFRVELAEVEAVLTNQEGVDQAVVAARPAASGETELVAYVVPGGDGVKTDQVRRSISEFLPAYMVPSYIVEIERLPLTPNGKVDRNALPAPAAALSTASRDTEAREPRTPAEEVLQRIWSRVLKIEQPGIHENFYDLGGHSLQAIRIIDAAATAGLNVSPLQFFQSPTIAGLAVAASARTVKGAGSSSLVMLREHGDGAPLFLLHSTPGDIVGYTELVAALPSGRPIYGLQSIGLQEVERAHRSIRSMASHYAEEILRMFPRGPYHVAGWCFGGTVALEVARELRARGATMGVVCLMETFPKGPRGGRYWLRRAALATRMGTKGAQLLINEFRTRLSQEAIDPADAEEVHALSLAAGPFKHRRAVHDINLTALRAHRTSYYPGEVTIIKALHTRGGLRDTTFGWPEFVAGAEIHEFDSSHSTMLKAPMVEKLALALQRAIEARDPLPTAKVLSGRDDCG